MGDTLKYESMEPVELMNMPLSSLIERCEAWCKEFNEGNPIKIKTPEDCPIHQWVVHNKKRCGQTAVPAFKYCSVCGNPCCPNCYNHKVEQLSRITGYIGVVSSWNNAKKQELLDRKRYDGL